MLKGPETFFSNGITNSNVNYGSLLTDGYCTFSQYGQITLYYLITIWCNIILMHWMFAEHICIMVFQNSLKNEAMYDLLLS